MVCMEYFTRIIAYLAKHEGFAYHTRSKGMKLNHLCFGDDVLIFCKGEFHAVLLMLRGFENFSKASGLTVNVSKSNVYCANMNVLEIANLCELTGYQRGALPFIYLGCLYHQRS